MKRRAFLLSTLIAPFAAALAPAPQYVDFGLLSAETVKRNSYVWRAQHVEYSMGVQIERSLWDGKIGPDITLDSLKSFNPLFSP